MREVYYSNRDLRRCLISKKAGVACCLYEEPLQRNGTATGSVIKVFVAEFQGIGLSRELSYCVTLSMLRIRLQHTLSPLPCRVARILRISFPLFAAKQAQRSGSLVKRGVISIFWYFPLFRGVKWSPKLTFRNYEPIWSWPGQIIQVGRKNSPNHAY